MIRRNKTVFKQFMISFVSIVVPILLCGVLLITWQINVIQDEIKTNAGKDVRYGIDRLEAQIAMVKQLQLNLMDDKEWKNFLRTYDKVAVWEYYTAVVDVMDRLEDIKQGNECIESVSVYLEDAGIFISEKDGYGKLSVEEYERLDAGIGQGAVALSWGEEEICILVRSTFAKMEGKISYIIKVNLSKETLFKEYLMADADSESYVFLYEHGAKQLLYMPKDGITDVAETIRPYLENSKNMQKLSYNNKRYLVVWEYSQELNLSLSECIPMTRIIQVQNRFYGLLAGYLILSGILAILFPYSVKHIVNKPISQLTDAFKEIEKENLQVRISYQAADEFNYLYSEFNHMAKRLEMLIDENYRSKLYAQKAELKQMQAQISPHFLYNTYFMLHRMILDEDLEYASRLSEHLGNYMEYITHNSEEEVFLEKEVDHMQSYLGIQSMRFGNRMHVHMQELPAGLARIVVPRLILQPVIENYLKYGYEMSGEEGDFYITFEENEKGFCIVVSGGCAYIEESKFRDLEQRLASEVKMIEVTGLINIHRRLRIKYGSGSGIYIQRDEEGRLITRLVVNYKEGEGNV